MKRMVTPCNSCLFALSFLRLFVVLLFPGILQAQSAVTCPPAGYSKVGLLELRQSGFVIADDAERNSLAIALLACVAEPDPELRDGVTFEGLTNWLRGGKLNTKTYQTLYSALMLQLQAAPDMAGFRQPFAALILSEVARVDRIEFSLSADQRELLVMATANYLAGIKDYRGFSETEGWRHGVAHGSDLALQLVLNAATTAGHMKTLLDAVATQVAPGGEIFYIYGEPSRMARAVFYAHQRNILLAGFWQDWFTRLVQAEPLSDWSEAFSSQTGLAKRHNTVEFLLALHWSASTADDDLGAQLDEWVMQALAQIP